MKMKKFLLFSFLLLYCITMLTGCAVNLVSHNSYENGDKYKVGEASISGEIRDIKIHWVAGGVTLETADTDQISFTEKSNKNLSEKYKMHYFKDGTTLHIQFAESGLVIKKYPQKYLKVEVPESITLDSIDISSVSADIDLDDVKAKKADLLAVSGDIDVSGVVTESVELKTTSGDIIGKLEESMNKLEVHSVSGDTDIDVVGVKEFNSKSTSGEVCLNFENAPEKGDIKTVSGDAKMYLPENTAFSLSTKTTSGTIKNDFENNNENSQNHYKIRTTSGNITIRKR